MRVAQFDAFGKPLYLADRDVPTARPHGVVIQVLATGLCRSDWHGWQGHDSDITELPHVPGHEFAGIISEVGADVKNWKIGDRVTVPFVCGCGDCIDCKAGNAQVCLFQWQPGFNGPGSFAEYVRIPHADFNVIALPDSMTFETAAALGCRFATSYRAVVHVGKVQATELVAVFGCGGIGLAAVMIAKSRGATVVGIDTSNPARDRARLAGADYVLDSIHDDVVKELKKLRPAGADLTIDALGSIATSKLAVESLRRLGRHVQVGLLPPAEVKDQATIPMHTVISRELTIMGSHGMSAAHYPQMLSEIADGTLRPDTLVERTITLEQAPDALAGLSSNPLPGITVIKP
jgi:alcohol dehydrogenase